MVVKRQASWSKILNGTAKEFIQGILKGMGTAPVVKPNKLPLRSKRGKKEV